MQLSQEKLNEKNRAKILKSLAFAEVRFKPKNGNCNDVSKDIEKNVKTQEVKPIHKMSQRPEIPRRYGLLTIVCNILG